MKQIANFNAAVLAVVLSGGASHAHAQNAPIAPVAETSTGVTPIQGEKRAMSTLTAKEKIALIKAPTTPEEFLRNVKFVIDNELLIDENFFSDENLMRFYQKEKVESRKRKRSISAQITGISAYATVLGFRTASAALYPRNSAGKDDPNGHLYGVTSVDVNAEKSLSTELISSVLGSWHEVEDPYKNENLRHPQPLLPATHLLGNKHLIYQFEAQKTKSIISILLASNGNVRRFGLSQEEK